MNSCRYDSYENIPAKVFFEIREGGNFSLLCPKPKTSTEWLKKVFMQIFDDRFKKVKTEKAENYLFLLEKEKALEVAIEGFTNLLETIWKTPFEIWDESSVKKFRDSIIGRMNEFLDEPIYLDGDFDAEVEKALNISIGIMKNDLTEVQMELEQLRKEVDQTVFEFYESLQNIDEWNNQSSDPNLLLAQYDAKEKSAVRKMERERLRNTA